MQTFAARIRSIIADSFNHARRARRRKTSEPQRFRMEFLEDRVLLSSDPTLAAVVEELIESPGAEVLAWSDTESLDAAEEAGEEIAEKQPLFTYRDAYENTYGPFDYDTFVRAESSDVEEISEVDEPLLELAALFTLDDSLLALDVPNTTADALTNNNGGATGTSAFTQSETTVIAFGNTVLVGFNDSGSAAGATGRFTGFSLSTDGGATFTDGGTLPANPGGDGGDPVLARNDATGRIYFATLSPALGTIQMFRSDTDGATWMLPVNATPGGIGEDKPWIIVDNFAGAGNGNVYVVSRRFGGTAPGIYFFRSTDDGATFGPSGGTLMVAGSQGAFVSVGTDHSVYVFWWAGTSLQMRKSTDFGLSFGAPVTVATGLLPITGDLGLAGIRQGTAVASGFRSNQFPHAAVNPVNGSIYVTYNTDVPGTDKTDVFVVQSTDGGTTWSAPVRVNDDLTTTDQWQPTIAVSTDGTRLGVFYSSREEDPGNNFFKYYGRIASISGSTLTFGPSFAISDTPSLPEFGRDSLVNPIYMGDYNTAYATPGFFHLSWSDNRDDLVGGAGRKDPSVYYK